MAKTKFLDQNGLSKLVEKIKNTYVNKNEQYEANLKWGGRNFADSFGPIDAAMIPELGANRFAFGNPRGIIIEYSNDCGSTWHDYGASDTNKGRLLSDGYPFIIGKVKSSTPANDMLRITIDTSTKTGINCYAILNKFVIKISTQGSVGCYCTIQKALQSTPTNFLNVVSKVNIDGWTGYNVINVPTITTYGNTENSQYGRLRFIFGSTGNNTSYDGLAIHKIYAFGGVSWNVPSNIAKDGHLYDYDYAQNAIFPANITAKNFIGILQGNASSATYADKYSYNGIDRDFVYDFVEGGSHYIKCKDTTIITKKDKNINNYDFVLNPDGKGGCYIYDGPNAKGAFWGLDGMVFEKAPANSLVSANGTFVTAITDAEIQNEIDKAITL